MVRSDPMTIASDPTVFILNITQSSYVGLYHARQYFGHITKIVNERSLKSTDNLVVSRVVKRWTPLREVFLFM